MSLSQAGVIAVFFLHCDCRRLVEKSMFKPTLSIGVLSRGLLCLSFQHQLKHSTTHADLLLLSGAGHAII